MLSKTLLTLVLVSCAANASLAGGVRIVQAPGLGLVPDLQAAVDAAADGDTLLVAPGDYGPFVVDGKSLWIVSMESGGAEISGTVEVTNLAGGQAVVLIGLSATGASVDGRADPGLRLFSNNGHVRAQSCTFRGGAGALGPFGDCTPFGHGGHGVSVEDCLRVVFVRSMLLGGDGGGSSSGDYLCYGGDGGHGVDALQATVALYDTFLLGGRGGTAGTQGGDGGHGYTEPDYGVVASGSTFEGGRGGDAWDFLAADGGDGGDGLAVDVNAQAQLVGGTFTGGAPGESAIDPIYDGAPGVGISGGGVVVQHPVAPRTFGAPPIASDGAVWTVNATVEPGDALFVPLSTKTVFKVPSPVTGIRVVPIPRWLDFASSLHGTPSSASPTVDVFLRDFSHADHVPTFGQGITFQGGVLQLGSPLHVLVFDREGSPDCDGNGVIDWLDVHGTPAGDCNANLVPDACDVSGGGSGDCNANLVPDECDVASGSSQDVNANGVPDECEVTNTTWWVDAAAPAGGTGTAAQPFRALGDALAVAFTGDTVIVRDGVYTGAANRELSFAGRDLVVRSESGPAGCVLDCQDLGRAFDVGAGVFRGARIEGFTIVNGRAAGAFGDKFGGGIRVEGVSSLVIADCVIRDGYAELQGGGIFVNDSTDVAVEDCAFISNRAANSGGAVYAWGEVGIRRCEFTNNRAVGGSGGAIFFASPEAKAVSHCSFALNTAWFEGGAISAQMGSTASGTEVLIDHCLFAGNTGRRGGALHTEQGGGQVRRVRVTSSTFVHNAGTDAGGALQLGPWADLELRGSILWANASPIGPQVSMDDFLAVPATTFDVAYSDLQGGQGAIAPGVGAVAWGPGNLAADPLFEDPDGPDGDPATPVDNDYRLGSGSPCVDAGSAASLAADFGDVDGDGDDLEVVPLDLDLAPRVVGAEVDQGAYERP